MWGENYWKFIFCLRNEHIFVHPQRNVHEIYSSSSDAGPEKLTDNFLVIGSFYGLPMDRLRASPAANCLS